MKKCDSGMSPGDEFEQHDMLTLEKKNTDEFHDFQPSISDNLRVGYCTTDRACQTETSEIVNLKQMSDVLSVLVSDLASLKKDLYYAKLTLQAEYDGRLQEAVLELYGRINNRIAEMEGVQREHLQIVRRSYKTQFSNALSKLSKDYHKFYGNKDATAEATYNQRMKDMKTQEQVFRRNEIAQQEMFEIMCIQVEEAKTKAEDVPSHRSSVISTSVYTQEIDELKSSMKEFESRVEYLEEMLEEANVDNARLNADIESAANKLRSEEEKCSCLSNEIFLLNHKIEEERIAAMEQLNEQRESLKKELDSAIQMTRRKVQDEAQKQMDDMKRSEAEKIYAQKMLEEKKITDLMEKHENEKLPAEVSVETDIGRLQMIERKQRAEIARLHKDLERTVKMCEMKVKISQEHIHALKDEMFLRTTLQRQAAKVRQAALTYARRGSSIIPLGVNPTAEMKLPRKHQLPTIIQAPKHVQDDTPLVDQPICHGIQSE